MRSILAFAFAALLALAPATPSFAETNSGSHAWSRDVLVLQNGPGSNYDVTGQIAAATQIMVLRCQRHWCLVDGPGGRGWTGKHDVDFGKGPYAIRPTLAGNTMCFFEGTNYTGRSFCANGGEDFPDLATWGWDNRIGSIQVEGTSADVCRDRFLQSYCERVQTSQPVLDQFLQGAVSSIRVH